MKPSQRAKGRPRKAARLGEATVAVPLTAEMKRDLVREAALAQQSTAAFARDAVRVWGLLSPGLRRKLLVDLKLRNDA